MEEARLFLMARATIWPPWIHDVVSADEAARSRETLPGVRARLPQILEHRRARPLNSSTSS